jgi:hypothetical protein
MSNNLATPGHASKTYAELRTTALNFINAQAQSPNHPQRMDFDLIKSVVTNDFKHTWGHNYAISLNPRLQGTHSFLLFTKHLEAMLPNLESWETTITDVIVDEVKRKVMLRASFIMVAKGMQEGVENDLLWILEMDDEEGKVRKSTEFIDGIAAAKLKEIMMSETM